MLRLTAFCLCIDMPGELTGMENLCGKPIAKTNHISYYTNIIS
ncbi:hypothetical protein PM3016_286 [Paenibacillus mucilaginosus 3016]|uniref:Uncharacterized protein n=1 Tax=Paenibacillus mucilaginosus 3016 TaxID=1116391 RepID=H6NRI0_9BACL|nr:hypothetical protein PM3016_286 [Paenibacillus mucilaginosus 3016]